MISHSVYTPNPLKTHEKQLFHGILYTHVCVARRRLRAITWILMSIFCLLCLRVMDLWVPHFLYWVVGVQA